MYLFLGLRWETLLCSHVTFLRFDLLLMSIRRIFFDMSFEVWTFGQSGGNARTNLWKYLIMFRSKLCGCSRGSWTFQSFKITKTSHHTSPSHHISITIIIVFKCTNQYCMQAQKDFSCLKRIINERRMKCNFFSSPFLQ